MFILILQLEMEVTLAKMVCILLFVWLFAWIGYATMSCWIMFFNARGLSPIMGILPTLCCKVSAGANSMLYGLRYYQIVVTIRKALQKLFDVNKVIMVAN